MFVGGSPSLLEKEKGRTGGGKECYQFGIYSNIGCKNRVIVSRPKKRKRKGRGKKGKEVKHPKEPP